MGYLLMHLSKSFAPPSYIYSHVAWETAWEDMRVFDLLER